MDERKARIENAAKKKAENERLENEYASMVVEEEKAFQEAQRKRINDEVENIRLNTKKAIDAARDERLQQVDAYRKQAKEEHEAILEYLNVHTEELAATFAKSIIKG